MGKLFSPKDIVPLTARDLKTFGDYVYAYFAPNKAEPFYVGKGRGGRLLSHWKKALAESSKYDQYKEIRKCFEDGHPPIVRLLAYNLQRTKRDQIYGG